MESFYSFPINQSNKITEFTKVTQNINHSKLPCLCLNENQVPGISNFPFWPPLRFEPGTTRWITRPSTCHLLELSPEHCTELGSVITYNPVPNNNSYLQPLGDSEKEKGKTSRLALNIGKWKSKNPNDLITPSSTNSAESNVARTRRQLSLPV